MSFAWPAALWSLLFIPILLLLYLLVQQRRSQYAVRFSNQDLLPNMVPQAPSWRRHAPVALYVLALTGLLLGLARPQAVISQPQEQATVVLVMDTSVSMGATDVQPNRLTAANAAAKRFLDVLPPQLRVALVSFSGSAQVLSGPTTDRVTLRQALDSMRADGGTAMGDALDLAVIVAQSALEVEGEVRTATPAPTPATARPRGNPSPAAILLLSDGANTAGQRQPLEVARRAQQLRIPVYTVALGTAEGTIAAPDGSGRRMAVPPDEATLQQVASMTGGRYFNAPSAVELQTVYENIGSHLSVTREPREVTSAFLAAGVILLIAGGALALLWFNRFP